MIVRPVTVLSPERVLAGADVMEILSGEEGGSEIIIGDGFDSFDPTMNSDDDDDEDDDEDEDEEDEDDGEDFDDEDLDDDYEDEDDEE